MAGKEDVGKQGMTKRIDVGPSQSKNSGPTDNDLYQGLSLIAIDHAEWRDEVRDVFEAIVAAKNFTWFYNLILDHPKPLPRVRKMLREEVTRLSVKKNGKKTRARNKKRNPIPKDAAIIVLSSDSE